MAASITTVLATKTRNTVIATSSVSSTTNQKSITILKFPKCHKSPKPNPMILSTTRNLTNLKRRWLKWKNRENKRRILTKMDRNSSEIKLRLRRRISTLLRHVWLSWIMIGICLKKKSMMLKIKSAVIGEKFKCLEDLKTEATKMSSLKKWTYHSLLDKRIEYCKICLPYHWKKQKKLNSWVGLTRSRN